MNPREFYDKVVQMRLAQKEYFKTRTSSSLIESKRLEKAVDDEIARVQKIINDRQNPKLWQD